MRRTPRLIAAAVLIAFTGILGGCSSFDPSDMLDFLDTKKKLPGERKEVFPDGVPGLEQGVPKDLYKGAVEQQQLDQQNAAAAPPPEEPKTKKSKAKSKRPATASTAPAAAADPAAPEQEGGPAAVAPAPKPKKTARRSTTAPPPDQQAAQPPPAQPGQSAQPFPAPLPGGSFSR